ncbi:MAG: ANTAR domain-containing response regulator [Christensenellales bacterium]|jgi:AmiR/NasT family two-component response regulator
MTEKPPVSVLVVSGSPKDSASLIDMLPPAQFSPVSSASNASEAKRRLLGTPFDIVIINTPLKDEYGVELALEIAKTGTTAVLLFVRNDMYEQVAYKVEDYGVLTLQKPASRQVILQSIRILVALQAKLKAMQEKASDLQTKMEEIRLVNRAKLLLMEKLKMTEAEAHRYIGKQAMDACVKRTVIAEDIIRKYGD